jgi:hypothetical protein
MRYRLVEITPEEYVALGTAGVWVFGSDGHSTVMSKIVFKHYPNGDGCDPDYLARYARPNVFPGQPYYFRHYYTRVEQDADQDV